MRLPAGAVQIEPAQREAAFLDHEACLVLLGRQPYLDLGLVFGSGFHRQQEVMRSLTDIDASRTCPGAGERRPERAADTEISGHLGGVTPGRAIGKAPASSPAVAG